MNNVSGCLLDTDMFSEILKRRDPEVRDNAKRYLTEFGYFTTTAVTVHEILMGLTAVDASRQIAMARAAFQQAEVVEVIGADFDVSGVLRGKARKKGIQIDLGDSLIAATASRLGLTLATGNTAHFEAIRQFGLDLEIVNWREPAP